MDPLTVLALNSGSSSLKFGLHHATDRKADLILEGEAEEIGHPSSTFWTRPASQNKKTSSSLPIADAATALDLVFKALQQQNAPSPEAIGHRVVHGGSAIRDHVVVTPEVMDNLRSAMDFAPLHVPAALHSIEACMRRMNLPQVACLDTEFHRSMPDVARTIPLPKSARDMGLERFGFHGLSLQSIVDQMKTVPARTVIAHLGGGCSVTALFNGQSVDTSMGFTPTGGIMMGTRPGDLDPGALLFLMRQGFESADELEKLLDRESGLLGVSETGSDMRELRKQADSDARADLALRLFTYQIRKTIGAMAACLGGLDALIFTGGIGEHDAQLRQKVILNLRFLGDFQVMALPSKEEATIAKITAGLCATHR